ncbi:MAG: FAD-dependent oxidoreductase [Acidobacteria bacterium]|nr:FAD-dependent oxidoreductase [Acidobacteriota bacterium]
MEQARVVIVGGGVVGCALAAEVALHFEDVFIIEQMPRVGMVTSSRNSGVVHSGIYYPPGSLKARYCVDGNRLTLEFCAAHNVPHRKTGKFVVATTPEEEVELEHVLARGRANGVAGLELIPQARLNKHEPHVRGRVALWVPSAGILESEELTKAYARVAANRGAHIVTNAKLEGVEPRPNSVRIRSTAGELEAQVFVNCAGLFADEVAALFGPHNYRIYPVRGEYWEVVKQKAYLINGLVYPAPDPTGLSLGVHFTKTLWGTVLIGPNARYVADKNDYERDRETLDSFLARARRLLPDLAPEDLRQAYSGLRPKLVPPDAGSGPDSKHADFVITRDPDYPHVIHLIGIDSPGLTAALSIAREVTSLIIESLA